MNQPISQRLSACRSCSSASLDPLLDLGKQPPANSLRKNRDEVLPCIPLEICRCSQCGTVQLTETVEPEYLFRHYVWVTGTSKTANEYSQIFRDEVLKRYGAFRNGLVVEVASNDGTFLRRFKEAGLRVQGVDPAANIAKAANEAGIPTWAEFFNQPIAAKIRSQLGAADISFARNVLSHVPDPVGIMRGMAEVLHENGIAVVEFHHADAILDELHYDSIYHEHLFYHSLASMEFQLRRAGLYPFDLLKSPISGGSLVVFCGKTEREPSATLQQRRNAEASAGTNTLARWQDFARKSITHGIQLRQMVDGVIAQGKKMIGYGASARSSTLMNFCGIDHRQLMAVADQSSYKHHLWTPGTDVLILPPAEALALKPDAVLLLAWNFRDEILAELGRRGFVGQVVLPLPGEPRLLTV